MGEKYYVIREWDGGPGGWTVTRAELARRLYAIAGETGFLKREITDRHIDILIHGEKEQSKHWTPAELAAHLRATGDEMVLEKEQQEQIPKIKSDTPLDGRYIRHDPEEKPWPSPDDITRMRRKDQQALDALEEQPYEQKLDAPTQGYIVPPEPCRICKKVNGHEAWCSAGSTVPMKQGEPVQPEPQPVTRQEAMKMANETLEQAERERLPQPDEWDAWAERMPDLSFDEPFLRWTIAMRKWARAIPCNPGRK
ncbi:MAG: hypothetical protein EHM49_02345 [Deltaproteobacteria bacterium]|nr:MAG: hypothetical protein EHM49_02345 [Deltaproteobacteria bacterium]